MRPTEKNPQTQSVASPPNPGRRRFLRDVLIVSVLAPLSCKSEKPDSTVRKTVYQNREFQVGSSTVVFDGCSGNSANFRIYDKGGEGVPDSVSMLVPGLFKVQDRGVEYEVDVESVSCSGIQSADLLIVKKSIQEEGQQSIGISPGVPIAGAAFTILSILISMIKGRGTEPEGERGTLLGPKRPQG